MQGGLFANRGRMRTHLLLSVGNDPELMKVRSLVLLQAGYALREARNGQEAVKIFADGDFDLVIICHTVPEEARIRLIKTVRLESPSAKIIVIRKDGELSARMADETVHSLDGPEALLQTVKQSLAKPN
jgi:DNA-binding response OmpR family regulator